MTPIIHVDGQREGDRLSYGVGKDDRTSSAGR